MIFFNAVLNFVLSCVDKLFNKGPKMQVKDEIVSMVMGMFPDKIPTTPHQDAIMAKVRANSGIAVVQDKGTSVLLMGAKMNSAEGCFIQRDANPKFTTDVIVMNSDANNSYWYSVLFHELAHATGTRARLCRMGVAGMFSNPVTYAIEEIIAETVATRIMERMDLATDETRERSKKYIQGYEGSINRHGAIVDVVQLDQDFDKAEAMVLTWLQGVEIKAA
jgi:Zincin-like metallopeptidase